MNNREKLSLLCLLLGLQIPALAIAQAADPIKGKRLAEIWCSECHVIGDGAQVVQDAGPPFSILANDPKKSEAALRGFLHHPKRPMPSIELSNEDIDHLVAYLKGLKKK